MDVPAAHQLFVRVPVKWPWVLLPGWGRATRLPHGCCGPARLPSRRSLAPVFSPTNVSGIWEASKAPQRLLVHRAPYQLLMRPCLGSQTGSFLQPQSPSPLWSQKKVISLREDFLGALPIFHTKSPGYIFHGRHLQIGWLLSDKAGDGSGWRDIKGANGFSN